MKGGFGDGCLNHVFVFFSCTFGTLKYMIKNLTNYVPLILLGFLYLLISLKVDFLVNFVDLP